MTPWLGFRLTAVQGNAELAEEEAELADGAE